MQYFSRVTGKLYEAAKTERLMVAKVIDYGIFYDENLESILCEVPLGEDSASTKM